MALTVTHLASPSSFLLTLETLDTSPAALSTPSFTILLDPVLPELPVLPAADLVLISSARRRHCHEATLRRLPPRTTSILAVPAAARRIRRWRHFEAAATVGTLPRWDSSSSSSSILRIPVLSRALEASTEAGEITLTCIGRRRDAHAAIGITYRPPTATRRWWCAVGAGGSGGPTLMLPPPPPPPRLPTPALSFSSSSSSSGGDCDSPAVSSGGGSPPLRAGPTRPPASDRGISIIFAPRGISYRSLQSYATTHLLAAHGPLTALVHRFDDPSSSYSRYLSTSPPPPSGQETASALGARAWINAHTGGHRRTYKSAEEEMQRALDERSVAGRTEVRTLAPGEELTMTSEGIWEEESLFADVDDDDGGKVQPGRLFGLGLDIGEDEDGRILGGALPVDWIDAVGASSSVRLVKG